MEATERLVRTWMASKRDEEIEETVSGISDGEITLLDVVKSLGRYLTSEENNIRTKGVDFLSSVITRCPSDKINRQSTGVLTKFYCGKLDDTETIIPALKGLTPLVSLSTCVSSDVEGILNALFAHIKMRALEQSARFLVFTIIDTLMARHRDVLKTMGKTFISNYIIIAEGEKDPRNLLVAFAIVRVVLIEFDISDHVESLYNITFCYFPISFRPPPDYKYAVTADDLRMALRSCLNATPLFGPLAIPLFLEKLNAGSPATKRDTLQTMSSCLPIYGAALARSSSRKLWSSLKLEIFQPTDPETEEEALKATQVLIRTLYETSEVEVERTDIQGLAREACEECIKILKEPEKSQARPATKVLCAFFATTPSVSHFAISRAIPHFIKLFLDPDETPNRPAVLILLGELVVATQKSTGTTPQSTTEDSDVPLRPFKDEILGVFTVGLKTSNSLRPALAGLKSLVTAKNLLTDEELGFIVHNVNEGLQIGNEATDDASDEVLDLLTTLSASSPRHVEEQTLPLLFSSLPDQAPSREATAERAKYWKALQALGKLCQQPELFETLVIRLSTKLDLISVPVPLPAESDADTEPTAAYAHSILTIIDNTLAVKLEQGHVDIPKYIERLVPRLYNLFISATLSSNGSRTGITDSRVIAVAAEIITIITQTLTPQRQQNFATALSEALLHGDYSKLAEGHRKIPPNKPLLFEPTATIQQKDLVSLFAAPVIAFHKEVRIPVGNLDEFLDRVTAWSLDATSDAQRDSGLHIVASIVNKQAEDITTFLSAQLELFWPREILHSGSIPERRRNAIKAWIWISKALLVRNHPDMKRFVDRLFEALGDETIGWGAARAVGTICGSDTILTKKNHTIIKFLYAQKYLSQVLPRIIEGAKNLSDPGKQTTYLVALASLIKAAPKITYAHEMANLMPLLLRGLDLPDNEIRANVIDTLLAAAEGSSPENNVISEHASTLITTMLKNSMVYEMPTVRVRIAALHYLAVLPSIVRYDVLHPHKANVIRELSKVLDDPKRSVRKEAVDARTNWFRCSGK